ncbi:NAD kinase [Parabacteroides sp. PFB2-10]|uniref:NAD kinase n=1 Tax=Parabacteroides sp. PFB2-10 TaxID=1742405 RepID=UPI0024751B72|nr:NAD kinase [Parabacteroides sp. PFB2-10]MDL2245250.1 NAD kinase [Parabacteroides sp. OttesenSCG-928-J18]
MKVGIFGSHYLHEKQSLIKRLFEKLRQLEAKVYVDESFFLFLTGEIRFTPSIAGLLPEEGSLDLDVALSIGGDGTFLHTAARIHSQNIPILGINTGRLGFLADIAGNDVEDTLDELFKNYYRIEERTLLQLVTEEELAAGFHFALNEVAILKRDTSSMITIHATLNDDFLASYQADGLVVATPTGSTAYSMSVNGPIIVPQSNSFVLSPVAPHSLNMRPLVIPDSTVIGLTVESRSDSFLVALDGRSEVFPAGASFRIVKADYTTKIVKRYNHTFYQTLREKLMWGADSRNK